MQTIPRFLPNVNMTAVCFYWINGCKNLPSVWDMKNMCYSCPKHLFLLTSEQLSLFDQRPTATGKN